MICTETHRPISHRQPSLIASQSRVYYSRGWDVIVGLESLRQTISFAGRNQRATDQAKSHLRLGAGIGLQQPEVCHKHRRELKHPVPQSPHRGGKPAVG